jgi:hypothetical protein
MNLSTKKNWFGKYYDWVYTEYPENICTFFWGTLTITLLFPLVIPGTLIVSRRERMYIPGGMIVFFSSLLTCILFLFAAVIINLGNAVLEIFEYKLIHWAAFIFGGLLVGLLTIAVIVGMALLFYILYVYIQERKRFRREKKRLEEKMNTGSYEVYTPSSTIWENIASSIGAIRGKYCSRITWID